MSNTHITRRHCVAMQTAVNGILAQSALLDNPRAYLTAEDARIAFNITAMYLQVGDVVSPSKQPGRVDQGSPQTQGGSVETIATQAVSKVLEETEVEIVDMTTRREPTTSDEEKAGG